MQTLWLSGPDLFVQDGAAGAQAVGQSAAPGALLEGPGPAPYVFIGAFIIIFLFVLVALIRSRVIAPARRKAMNAEFFEPAGADANITFDAPDAAENAKRRKNTSKGKCDKLQDSESEFAHPPDVGDLDDAAPGDGGDRQAGRPAPKPKKDGSPFAGLFKKKKTARPAPADRPRAEEIAEVEITPAPARREEPEDFFGGDAFDDRFAAEEENHLSRAEEADDEIARPQSDPAGTWDRDEAEVPADTAAEFERRKAESVLEQRMQSLTAMQRKLADQAQALQGDAYAAQDRLGASLEERFAALADELNAKLESAAEADAGYPGLSRAIAAEVAHSLSRDIDALRQSTQEALGNLTGRLDAINAASPDGAARLSQEISKLNALLGGSDRGDLVAEIDALRRRVAALEDELNRTRKADAVSLEQSVDHPLEDEMTDPPPATESHPAEENGSDNALAASVEDAFERLQQEEALSEARRSDTDRRDFPLRPQKTD